MKTVLQVKIQPTAEQAESLLRTMERVNEACNHIAKRAHEIDTASRVRLHREVYREVRDTFGLSSRMTDRAIGKVTEALRRDRATLHEFRPHGAIVYDDRLLSWKAADRVSILTLDGRTEIPVVMGEYQRLRIERVRGQADLVYRDGRFFLYCTVDTPEPPEIVTDGDLGVDLGIKNIATDSDGDSHSGAHIASLRNRHTRLRSKLQAKGTKSAKRLLRKRRRKEMRFARDVNHRISKGIVRKAKGTARRVVLEDLKGIRQRTTVRRSQRRAHSSWSFHQLRSFIEYKARLEGVPLVVIDPRNTSRECPECGYTDKRNRPTRDSFRCKTCGFAAPADVSAARVIASRAAAVQPNAPRAA